MDISLVIIYIFFTVSGLMLIKLNSASAIVKLTLNNLNIQFSWMFIAGIVCYVLSFILWVVIVSKFNLSNIFPIATSLVYIFVLLGSYFLLGEELTVSKIIASIIILIGIVIMQIKF